VRSRRLTREASGAETRVRGTFVVVLAVTERARSHATAPPGGVASGA